jgi:hypothetical protein
MAAAPLSMVATPVSYSKRPRLMLTPRRLAANRHNAALSTGPRTARGKARVACNAVKHGFFAGPQRWTPGQYRDFIETLDGLRAEFEPQTVLEDRCVRTIADSYVRMAAMLRYENIAALKYHQWCERELEGRIAAATPWEAANLRARREELRKADLWGPTIPGPREAAVIIRYEGRLNRAIRGATASLDGRQAMRVAANTKAQKQTHFLQENRGIFGTDENAGARPRASMTAPSQAPAQSRRSQNPQDSDDVAITKSAKTNPLNPASMGNRHERRRAKALARHRRPDP